MTQVTNTIVDASGQGRPGIKVEIELWPAASGYMSGQTVEVVYSGATDSDGKWVADLVPNASLVPSGTVYKVREIVDDVGVQVRVHTISVPLPTDPPPDPPEVLELKDLLAVDPEDISGPVIPAATVIYDNDASGLAGDDVQEALDELAGEQTAKLDESNTFPQGPQTVQPGGAEDGWVSEIDQDHTGRQSVWTRWSTGKGAVRSVVAWVDYVGKFWLQTLDVTTLDLGEANFGSPVIGSPGTGGKFARASHEHNVPIWATGIGGWASYPLKFGAPFDDLGAITNDGQEYIHDIFIPAWDESTGDPTTVSEVSFWSGAQAMSGCTHIWAAVRKYIPGGPFELVAQSVDEPGATWAANTKKTFSWGAVPFPTIYEGACVVEVSLMIVATQHPSLRGFHVPALVAPDRSYSLRGTSTGLTDTAPAEEPEELPSTVTGRPYCEVLP